jgi:hypothetical protein
MKFDPRHPFRGSRSIAGFTLIEMMTSVGLGMIVLTGAAILYINGNECFVAMANYQNLDKYSSNAMDLLSKEIRAASGVISTNSTSILFTNRVRGGAFSVNYYTNYNSLVLKDVSGNIISTDTGQSSVTNLVGCVTWTYSTFMGVPNIGTSDFTFQPPTQLGEIEVIQMNWRCQRTYIGRAITTESVQTAQIVMRNY